MEPIKQKTTAVGRRIVWLGFVLVLVGIDQWTKYLITEHFALGETKALIPGVLHLSYVRNTGAAFGILQNHRWVFMVLSSIAIIGVFVCLWVFARRCALFCTALAMIAGGGIGNMIDRCRLGYVTDFIDLRFIDFAVFNAADSFVCIGCALLLFYLLFFDARTAEPLFCTREKRAADDNNGDGIQ